VRADGFSAEYTCSVHDGELQQLHADLQSALARLGHDVAIRFCSMERGITLEMAMNRRGHIEGKYEFWRDWRGPCLSGSFSADQTHLALWASELGRALAG
jgi:hypothetical protein